MSASRAIGRNGFIFSLKDRLRENMERLKVQDPASRHKKVK
jgi:hypothetical protein